MGDDIGLEELGNPGWDPFCFCSPDGKKYYMPALIRLSLATVANEFYFSQLLFHLEEMGKQNDLVMACTAEQREFIAAFVEYMIETYPEHVEAYLCADQAFRVLDIWSMA